jgi:hypothetical protein
MRCSTIQIKLPAFRLQVKIYLVRYNLYTFFCRPPVGPYARIKLRFKTFKGKYLWAFGLKILSRWREKWDESTGIWPKKRKPTIPKLSTIKRTAFLISLIILSDLSTIQFRLAFKDKGRKSLEYCCLYTVVVYFSPCSVSFVLRLSGEYIQYSPLINFRSIIPSNIHLQLIIPSNIHLQCLRSTKSEKKTAQRRQYVIKNFFYSDSLTRPRNVKNKYVILRHLGDMCLFTSALRASVNKSHIPSLPQNNLYINTFDIRKYNFLRWIERWYFYPLCIAPLGIYTNTISFSYYTLQLSPFHSY